MVLNIQGNLLSCLLKKGNPSSTVSLTFFCYASLRVICDASHVAVTITSVWRGWMGHTTLLNLSSQEKSSFFGSVNHALIDCQVKVSGQLDSFASLWFTETKREVPLVTIREIRHRARPGALSWMEPSETMLTSSPCLKLCDLIRFAKLTPPRRNLGWRPIACVAGATFHK